MSIRATVTSQFEKVASEQKKRLARLSDDLKLLESGFDSLDFALVIAYLENELGYDPFEAANEMKYPVTFGEFVKLYESDAKAPLPT
jgi:acyl carrier protein